MDNEAAKRERPDETPPAKDWLEGCRTKGILHDLDEQMEALFRECQTLKDTRIAREEKAVGLWNDWYKEHFPVSADATPEQEQKWQQTATFYWDSYAHKVVTPLYRDARRRIQEQAAGEAEPDDKS